MPEQNQQLSIDLASQTGQEAIAEAISNISINSGMSSLYRFTIQLSSTWIGNNPYTQVVTIPNAIITKDTKIDIQPNENVFSSLISDGVRALWIENDNGTLIAKALGAMPTTALSIQCILSDTKASSAILDSKTITENGTYLALDDNLDGYSEVIVEIESSDSYPILESIFDQTLTNYTISIVHPVTMIDLIPASVDIENAITDYFTTKVVNKSDGSVAIPNTYSLSINNDDILKLLQSDFEKIWNFKYDGWEYKGNIYDSNIIQVLNLILLGDFSQGGNASNNTLLDSTDNYSGIILQGIYNKNRTSSYNTSFLYQDIEFDTEYFTGMKDRNHTYDCKVIFTDDITVDLSGNKQVIIYGIP